MDEREFFNETTEMRTHTIVCPKCGQPGDYKVTPGHGTERWTVTSLKDGTTIYNGIGPVEIRRTSP